MVVEAGAGVAAEFPDYADFAAQGAKITSPIEQRCLPPRTLSSQMLCYGSNDRDQPAPTCPLFHRNQVLIRISAHPWDRCKRCRRLPARASSSLLRGTDAANDPRAQEYGRALLDGHNLRMTRPCLMRLGYASQNFSDAHDRCRNDYSRARAGDRRGRCRLTGQCHGAQAGRGGFPTTDLRPAAKGAGAEPRRVVLWNSRCAGSQGRAGRRRVCQGAKTRNFTAARGNCWAR